MSTTARSSSPVRSGRAVDRSLSARAVRVRNAVLRHAAPRLGLRVPDDAELAALRPDVGLTQALQWLEQGPAPVTSEGVPTAPPFFLRAGCAALVTLLGLALSFGRVQ
jgi:hypothetical protein